MKLLWEHVKKYKKTLVLTIVLATISQVFSLIDPPIIGILIDKYGSRANELSNQEFLQGILLLIGLWILVALVSRIAKNFQEYFTSYITEKVGADLYQKGVKHSLRLPYEIFEDQSSGRTLEQLQRAREDSRQIINDFIGKIYLSSITLLLVIGYAFYVYWAIGLLYLITGPVVGLTSYFLGKRITKVQKEIFAQSNELAGSTTETLRNVELVKSLGLDSQEIGRLNKVTDDILALEIKKIKVIRLLSFLQGTMINFLRAVLIFSLLFFAYQGFISLGNVLTLMFYSFFVFNPIFELGNIIIKYHEAKASLENYQKILNQPVEALPVNPQAVNNLQKIVFNKVSFQHHSAEVPAVKDISLEIKTGEAVAFVGPSGSGKSTMMKLILGLYHPQHGKIYFNDIPTDQLDYQAWRKKIGFVSQETQLFAGTIKENLLFVKPEATDEELLKVLEQAAANAILARAKSGLDTRIGENGIKLSGGERQRLAIARALLRQPELLIFDEATSSLDSLTEKEIADTIHDISKQRQDLITISIAHRLSTIIKADRIYVLSQGQLTETGKHEDLLANNGLYQALWRQQTGV